MEGRTKTNRVSGVPFMDNESIKRETRSDILDNLGTTFREGVIGGGSPYDPVNE